MRTFDSPRTQNHVRLLYRTCLMLLCLIFPACGLINIQVRHSGSVVKKKNEQSNEKASRSARKNEQTAGKQNSSAKNSMYRKQRTSQPDVALATPRKKQQNTQTSRIMARQQQTRPDVDVSWSKELPSVQKVDSTVGNDIYRKWASYEVLLGYISNRILTVIGSAPPSGPNVFQFANQRQNEYLAAQKALQKADDNVATGARVYTDDHLFYADTIEALVSTEAAIWFKKRNAWYNSRVTEEAERKQKAAQQKQAEEHKAHMAKRAIVMRQKLAQDMEPGVNRNVFGIELGEQLDLPSCTLQSGDAEIVSGIFGAGIGGPVTCIGTPYGIKPPKSIADAETKELMNMPSEFEQKIVKVRLADAICPEWMRASRTCYIKLMVGDEFVLGAEVYASVELYNAAMDYLIERYGQPSSSPPAGISLACLDARKMHVWKKPGLTVTYDPIGAVQCSAGIITFKLDTLSEAQIRP